MYEKLLAKYFECKKKNWQISLSFFLSFKHKNGLVVVFLVSRTKAHVNKQSGVFS